METRIGHLDKQAVQHIRKRLEAALRPLAEELGVVFNLGTCAFTPNNGRFQFGVSVVDSNGNPVTEEIESFRQYAPLFGFESTDLGKEFTFRGQSYTICGLNPKNRKYPVLARSTSGRGYRLNCQTVLEALGRIIPPIRL